MWRAWESTPTDSRPPGGPIVPVAAVPGLTYGTNGIVANCGKDVCL